MTNEEWQKLEKRLLYVGSTVKLTIDGYDIDLQVQPDKLKMVIMVYVNGKFNFKYLDKECEFRQKFYCEKTKSLIPQKELKKLSKKRKAEMIEKYTYKYYLPYFETFRTLKRTLVKNNTDIQIDKRKAEK